MIKDWHCVQVRDRNSVENLLLQCAEVSPVLLGGRHQFGTLSRAFAMDSPWYSTPMTRDAVTLASNV
jgi:hypothetical protein